MALVYFVIPSAGDKGKEKFHMSPLTPTGARKPFEILPEPALPWKEVLIVSIFDIAAISCATVGLFMV
ncbi:hypothetical protein ROZALSC1DRAFT_29102, partial [Rozella allomycis CSF55]